MIYLTGDIHGDPKRILHFCQKKSITEKDIIIILGDVGANYYGGNKDVAIKCVLNNLGPVIFCIHGNHEIRPENISSYKQKKWHDGTVMFEEKFPNLLFAKDGEVFDLDGINYLVIGGAYSVDKYYRLKKNFGWWADEQPSDAIKEYVEQQIAGHHIDIVLSHTCPFKYEPVEMFLPMIDQSVVDKSTECWLDKIEESIDYKAWFCGHWHTDKRIDKIHFLFNGFESIEQFKKEDKN